MSEDLKVFPNVECINALSAISRVQTPKSIIEDEDTFATDIALHKKIMKNARYPVFNSNLTAVDIKSRDDRRAAALRVEGTVLELTRMLDHLSHATTVMISSRTIMNPNFYNYLGEYENESVLDHRNRLNDFYGLSDRGQQVSNSALLWAENQIHLNDDELREFSFVSNNTHTGRDISWNENANSLSEHSGDRSGDHSDNHSGDHSGDHLGNHSGDHSDNHSGDHSDDHFRDAPTVISYPQRHGLIIYGTPNVDHLVSSSGDTVFGFASGDTVLAGAGNDIVYGMDGSDQLFGTDNDILYGGVCNDTLDGGNDILFDGGNHGADILYGEAGNEALLGVNGTDSLYGGVSDADLLLGKDDEILWAGTGDIAQDDAGDDILVADASSHTLLGNVGDDCFSHLLFGMRGDDSFYTFIYRCGDVAYDRAEKDLFVSVMRVG